MGFFMLFIIHFCRKEKSVEYIINEFFHELFHGEHDDSVVDAANCLGKVVIVNAADEVSHELVPDMKIHTREDKLKKVVDTGTVVIVTNILENDITAGKVRVLITLVFEEQILWTEPAMTENTKLFQIRIHVQYLLPPVSQEEW